MTVTEATNLHRRVQGALGVLFTQDEVRAYNNTYQRTDTVLHEGLSALREAYGIANTIAQDSRKMDASVCMLSYQRCVKAEWLVLHEWYDEWVVVTLRGASSGLTIEALENAAHNEGLCIPSVLLSLFKLGKDQLDLTQDDRWIVRKK